MRAKKKIRCMVLSLLLILSFAISPCYAENLYEETIPLSVFNEWSIVETLEDADDEALSAYGINRDDATQVIDFYYNALYERASLTKEELIALDYSEEQIRLLETYRNTRQLSREEIRGITATFTDYISPYGGSGRLASFYYHWEWSSCPLIATKDSAALMWKGVKSDGSEIDLITSNRTGNIHYYYNTTYITSVTPQFETISFNGVNGQFNVMYADYAYAKSGVVGATVAVDDSVTENFSYIRIVGQYAHTTVGNLFPSISLSNPAGFSLTFSGNFLISPQGGHEVILYDDGSYYYVY